MNVKILTVLFFQLLNYPLKAMEQEKKQTNCSDTKKERRIFVMNDLKRPWSRYELPCVFIVHKKLMYFQNVKSPDEVMPFAPKDDMMANE